SKSALLDEVDGEHDQSCSSLIKLCSYSYCTPDFNKEFSDLEQERQVVQSPQPSMSRKEVIDLGDIPTAIWDQSKNMEFHKKASMAVSQIMETTVKEITTLFDSKICTIYQGPLEKLDEQSMPLEPSIKLPHNTGEAASGVVDIILEGVQTKSLRSIPGWVLSKLKGTKTSVETVSATALITTAMVQEVMGSVPLTRYPSVDTSVCLSKVEENSVESVLELHQAVEVFSAEVPRAIALSVVPAISTDKMPEPSLTITKAQGKTTKNRRERFYFPSCCPQKEQKKAKVSSVSTLSDKAMFIDDMYQDLLQEKGSAIKLCQSVEQLHLAVEECIVENSVESMLELYQAVEEFSAEVPRAIALSVVPAISTDKMPEPSLTITKAQGKATKNRRERFYFPSCCPQKEQKKAKDSSTSTLSDKAMFIDDVYQDLLQEKGSAIKLCQSVEQLHLAVADCSAERFPHVLGLIEENLVESVLELHQAVEEFSAEIPRAIALSVVLAISTDKMPEPSLTITKAQGKTTKNGRERFYFPSCCPQKEKKKTKVSSVSTSSDKAMFVDDAYQDLLQEQGSAIKLCQSVEQLHLAVEECSTEVPKAIASSVVSVISTEKMAESSLNTIAQGKQTNNRRERSYFPSFCLQKKKKQNKASSTPVVSFSGGSVHSLVCALLLKIRKNADGSPPQSEPELIEKALSVSGSVLTLLAEVKGMSVDEESSTPSRAPPDEVVEAVYKDMLQEKGSAIELHHAVEQCSAEVPRVIAWSLVKEISTAPPNEFLAAPAFLLSSVLLLSGHPSKVISLSGNAKSLVAAASDSLPKDESRKRFGLLPKLPKTHKMQKMPKLKMKM
ncbi:unnamed protein product, partial [Coregonus sp. 'balchen']